ncbi:hypothetical protein J4440_02085 [Candidatus Woesearchaeota archaeon]|nr:hypothetical protein [Candidatus Woesearchaeota archaeon]
METEYKLKKFDIVNNKRNIIHGIIYTEKPSFNYIEELKKKDKREEIKKLKILRGNLCTVLRINRNDLIIDEDYYRLLTSRAIAVRYQIEIKEMKLIPAIAEETKEIPQISIEIEYL